MASRRIPLVPALALVAGCAWTSQRVNLRPTVDVTPVDFGRGQAVSVRVTDERSRVALGNKIPTGGGELSPAEDPAEVVRAAIVLGLTRLGFTASGGQGANELDVELRAIDYKVTQGFWAGALNVDVAMKAVCSVDGRRVYEKLHRGHSDESIQLAQTGSANERYINSALSQAINNVLSDGELLRCLASSPAR